MVGGARQRFNFAEYVELEGASPVKHEYLDGVVWAMAGGSPDHAAIAVNISTELNLALRGRACRVYYSDLRVRVPATGLATYADVTVVWGKLQLDPGDARGHTVLNPKLIIEVLSPSTEDYDRGEKLAHYKQIPSLKEIVLVAHDARRLEVWRRARGGWALDVVQDEGTAALRSVGVELPLAEVYRDPFAARRSRRA